MAMSDNRLTECVQATVRAALRPAGHACVLVACSGGGDSVCLAHAAVMVVRQEGWQVVLGHVRHGLRVDDGDDAALIMQLAHALDVPVLVKTYPFGALAANETALRQARYEALAEMAAGFHATAVLTGHTRDDQAETVLLRLLRGAGVDGLAAIAPTAPFPISLPTPQRLHVLRPLLGVRRAETRAYCVARDLVYRDDPTNDDAKYRRNWVRHTVLPMLNEQYPAVVDTLARTADLMREDAEYLCVVTNDAIDRCTVVSSYHTVTVLERAAFAAEPVALQRRVLRAISARYAIHAPRADRLEIVRRALSEGMTTQMQVIGPVAFWPAYRHITIGREPDVLATVRHRAMQRHPLAHYDETKLFDGEAVFAQTDALSPFGYTQFRLAVVPATNGGTWPVAAKPLRLPEQRTLALRNRVPGDAFRPASTANGTGMRKLQDYLTNEGIPAALRDELPLLVLRNGDADGEGSNGSDDADEIVAVIGYDIAAAFSAAVPEATHMLILHRSHKRERTPDAD